MKLPWVSRARYELLEHNYEQARVEVRRLQTAEAAAYRTGVDGQVSAYQRGVEAERARHDALLDKYHALKLLGATATEPAPALVPIDEADVPPDEVLLAMQQISPVRDKTYEANWQHWERNKERARLYPKEFAEEIIQGAVFEIAERTA